MRRRVPRAPCIPAREQVRVWMGLSGNGLLKVHRQCDFTVMVTCTFFFLLKVALIFFFTLSSAISDISPLALLISLFEYLVLLYAVSLYVCGGGLLFTIAGR